MSCNGGQMNVNRKYRPEGGVGGDSCDGGDNSFDDGSGGGDNSCDSSSDNSDDGGNSGGVGDGDSRGGGGGENSSHGGDRCVGDGDSGDLFQSTVS